MANFPDETTSLCPHCFRPVAARRTVKNNAVYLEKKCPEHGALEDVLLWRNDPRHFDKWRRQPARPVRGGGIPQETASRTALNRKGCPFNCGICHNHKQHTCSVILEVAHACNLQCPICFASSGTAVCADPNLDQLERMMGAIRESAGASCPIQLSGGEPTLRDDLPQIVALARKMGFDHIQINTNGLRLARDPDFGRALKDAGADDFFLQFDGVSRDVYRRIRGADIQQEKMLAVERCAELQMGVILVPTLVRNVNENEIGDIIRFAKKWMPAIKGVHFQPMAYLGRHPAIPNNEGRILIPDILAAIEDQTSGELKAENFIPPG